MDRQKRPYELVRCVSFVWWSAVAVGSLFIVMPFIGQFVETVRGLGNSCFTTAGAVDAIGSKLIFI